jgi:predicted transglutaminase-like cysteine proteinase
MSGRTNARLRAASLALFCAVVLAGSIAGARALERDGGPPAGLSVASLESAATATESAPAEPFGIVAPTLVRGGIQKKWGSVHKRLGLEREILRRCRTGTSPCPGAAKRFLNVVGRARKREGWARIAEVNRTINLNIKPVDDMTQYGVVDLWATPLMAFKSNAGDCEDYAIAKYVALQELGTAPTDLRLVIVRDELSNEEHAVAAVRHDGRWLILDNRTTDIREDAKIPNYDPLFVIDGASVKRVMAPLARRLEPGVRPAANGQTASAGWPATQLLL